MFKGFRLFSSLFVVLLAFQIIHAQGIGNVEYISLVENGIAIHSNNDVVIFKACKNNILKVDYIPSGSESKDTLVIGNTSWDMVPVSIDTVSDPIVFETSKYKVLISKSPMRFAIYDSTGQQLCSEPAI